MRLHVIAIVPVAFLACAAGDKPSEDRATPAPTATFVTKDGPVTVTLEIADDPVERARGLMHREDLDPFAGMIFVFPREEEHVFWMKDTPIPLDMIFIDAQRRIVGIVENAEPYTLDPRTVGRPSLYVIEVRGGFAAAHGIEAGQEVALEGVPDRAAE